MRTKQKRKNILRLLAMSFAVVLLLWNCKKDNLEEENIKSDNRPFIESVQFEDVYSNKQLKTQLEKVTLGKTKSLNDAQARVTSSDGSFVVLTERIQHLVSEDLEQYAFMIETPILAGATFSEFILERSGDDLEYKMYIYNFTKNEDGYIVNRVELDVDEIDLSDFDSFISSKMVMIGNCAYEVLYYDNCCEYLQLVGCGGGGGSSGGDSGSGDSGSGDSGNGDSGNGDSGNGDSGNLGYNGDSDSGLNGGSSGGGSSGSGSSATSPGVTFTSPFFIPIIPTIEEILTDQYFDNLTPDQQDCLDAHPYLEVQIRKFLQDNIAPSIEEIGSSPTPDPATEFTDEAIAAVCGGGVADVPNGVVLDSTFANYPCQSMIVSEAVGVCSPLTSLVLNAFEANEGTNLVFSISNQITGNGSTFPIALYNPTTHTCDVKIKIRESYITTATDLSIARTVIHETVHALLIYMHEEGKFYLPSGIVNPTFSDLAEAYTLALYNENANGLGQSHHEYMVDLVEDIATSLSAFGSSLGYQLPFTYYRKMAWSGDLLPFFEPKYLQNGNFTPEYLTILNTNVAEQENSNNYTDGYGNQITPKGIPANTGLPCY